MRPDTGLGAERAKNVLRGWGRRAEGVGGAVSGLPVGAAYQKPGYGLAQWRESSGLGWPGLRGSHSNGGMANASGLAYPRVGAG